MGAKVKLSSALGTPRTPHMQDNNQSQYLEQLIALARADNTECLGNFENARDESSESLEK
jgi:hypothetical protein